MKVVGSHGGYCFSVIAIYDYAMKLPSNVSHVSRLLVFYWLVFWNPQLKNIRQNENIPQVSGWK